MRIRRSDIWLALSFSLLLGHTLLPHAHRPASHMQQAWTQNSSGDMWHRLGSLFAFDLGIGHLEHYQALRDVPDTAGFSPDETDTALALLRCAARGDAVTAGIAISAPLSPQFRFSPDLHGMRAPPSAC